MGKLINPGNQPAVKKNGKEEGPSIICLDQVLFNSQFSVPRFLALLKLHNISYNAADCSLSPDTLLDDRYSTVTIFLKALLLLQDIRHNRS